MKILETKQAPNPRRVRIFLAEKAIDMTYEQKDLMAGELAAPDFTALNPMQRVPLLILDDGTAIAESVSICRYFEELQPDPALMGTGALGAATVEMWQRRMELGLLFHVAQSFRHLHPAMAAREVPQCKDWGEAVKPKALEVLEVLDVQLADNQFVAGDAYTIADITALVACDFMKVARIERPDALHNVARWYDEVSARPSAKA